MPDPFSDTTSPTPATLNPAAMAATLAERLALPEVGQFPYGQWYTLLFAAVHAVLDRVEAIEAAKGENKSG